MSARAPSRADDERLLAMLAARRRGVPDLRIAARMGTTPGAVRAQRHKVMTDDVRLSGEPEAIVRAAYQLGWGAP